MEWPAGAPIEILDIPLIKTLTDASAAIVKTMAEDQISPEGAASTAAVIERAIEAIDSKTRSPLLSLRSRRMGDEFSTTPHALEEPAVRFSESFPL